MKLLPDGTSGRNVRAREGVWHFRYKWAGQEFSGSTGLDATRRNQKKAEEYVRIERRKHQQKETRDQIGFAEAAGRFIAWCRDTEYRSRPNTAGRIKTSFASIVEFFGQAAVHGIAAAEIESYKSHRLGNHKIREITLRHDLHALSRFFAYAMKMGWAASNPVKDVSIPSDRDAIREHVVTAEEEAAYFAAAAALHAKHLVTHPAALPNLGDVARLMLEQGCRPEEIMAARKENLKLNYTRLREGEPKRHGAPRDAATGKENQYASDETAQSGDDPSRSGLPREEVLTDQSEQKGARDVDAKREALATIPSRAISGTLLIAGGKTRAARRTLHLTAASMAILERRMQLPGPWLFPSDRHPGDHITKLQGSHDRACREAGVSFVIYDLRHTWATRAAQGGMDVVTLAAILGHSNLRCVMRYVHPTGQHQREAMATYEAAQKRRQLKVVG